MQKSLILANQDVVVVFYKGEEITVSTSVAAKLNLNDGYAIKSETEFWTIVAENAREDIELYSNHLNSQSIKWYK
jgi:hypothetical protein